MSERQARRADETTQDGDCCDYGFPRCRGRADCALNEHHVYPKPGYPKGSTTETITDTTTTSDAIADVIADWVFSADHFRPPGHPIHLDVRLDANARGALASRIAAEMGAV